MLQTICIYNNKGGCGKTLAAVNLAAVYSYTYGRLYGKPYKTLLIDLDPQANATHFLLRDPTTYSLTSADLFRQNPDTDIQGVIYRSDLIEDLYVIPASPDLDDVEQELITGRPAGNNENDRILLFARKLRKVADDYDMIIIDTHPSKKRLLNLNALAASTLFICPCDSDPESFEGLNGLMDTYHKISDINPLLRFGGVLFTRFRNTNADIHALQVLSENLVNEKGEPLIYDNVIPLRAKQVEARWVKIPPVLYAPSDEATKAYIALADEIMRKSGKGR